MLARLCVCRSAYRLLSPSASAQRFLAGPYQPAAPAPAPALIRRFVWHAGFEDAKAADEIADDIAHLVRAQKEALASDQEKQAKKIASDLQELHAEYEQVAGESYSA